ncbi:bifunctional serine/threonine-protein kinase/formylglycine-generating enzyme family protein [Zavarzinella formosa]|uniref:bifunctional serine/threonine-protein kinase/formylglycine-generating enzyme family protein n=1 Tax=Zavarzinella formosa TaxID=360055 RepID=UPI0002F38BCB|nr:bifunctional serine/threonine-protein kinase/formylglycine-generating enzyme family protein [Zavarzinella formosa]
MAMRVAFGILKAVGKAALNVAGGGFMGDVLVGALPAIAQNAWEGWRADRNEKQQHEEVQAIVRMAAAEIRDEVRKVIQEIAPDRPLEIQLELEQYLTQIPISLRQSLKSPADPTGRNPPADFVIDGPDVLLSVLPSRLPKFKPGDRPLAGIDWELVELLGCGGFGEVWKAKNPFFDGVPPVALKFCIDPSSKDRLLRHEAAVLNQVMRNGKHAGIVTLLHTYLSADPPCLEYEYVEGGDLTTIISHWTRSPGSKDRTSRATRLVLELAKTVGFAHRLSPPVVHRDLKPANILVNRAADGAEQLRIADFGIGGLAAGNMIAKSRAGTSTGDFLVTAMRGSHTPLYASPQQMRGSAPDPRDDVHALGVIWYQMLACNITAGRPSGTRWTNRMVDLGLSRDLIDLLGSCLEEDPNDRPADAAELADRLEKLLEEPKPVPILKSAPKVEVVKVLSERLSNTVGMSFTLIPVGKFLMGSPDDEDTRTDDEGPRHRVTITKPFHFGIYPVTQAEYERVMGENPSAFGKRQGGGPSHPVEQVSWEDAMEFCRRLSALPREVAAGRQYRLPTEAEWEYACRAGTLSAFSYGDRLSFTMAHFDGRRPYGGCRPGTTVELTAKVGQFEANPWGLFDMHGNVWEWCSDWYGETSYPNRDSEDPTGPSKGEQKALRGGSWNNSGHLCRSAKRNKYRSQFKSETIGFRVICEI